jgi:hypothetical protein
VNLRTPVIAIAAITPRIAAWATRSSASGLPPAGT